MKTDLRPELIHEGGWRGGYRLYTKDLLPYDAILETALGRSAFVVNHGWGVSYTEGAHLDGVELRIYTAPITGMPEYHELSGTMWSTRELAREAAYNAGCLSLMVYEDAARGCPERIVTRTYVPYIRGEQ